MKFGRIISIIVGLCVVAGLVTVIVIFNKPHTNVYNSQPKYSLSTIDLLGQYTQNEEQANKKYLGEILEVQGRLLAINTTDEGQVALDIEGGEMSYVTCWLSANESIDLLGDIKISETIIVKGICTGMLLDVVLTDCVIVSVSKKTPQN